MQSSAVFLAALLYFIFYQCTAKNNAALLNFISAAMPLLLAPLIRHKTRFPEVRPMYIDTQHDYWLRFIGVISLANKCQYIIVSL